LIDESDLKTINGLIFRPIRVGYATIVCPSFANGITIY